MGPSIGVASENQLKTAAPAGPQKSMYMECRPQFDRCSREMRRTRVVPMWRGGIFEKLGTKGGAVYPWWRWTTEWFTRQRVTSYSHIDIQQRRKEVNLCKTLENYRRGTFEIPDDR